MVDHHVDRPGVEAQQCVKLTGTNRSFGLILASLRAASRPIQEPGFKDPGTGIQDPGTGFAAEIGEGPGKGYNINAPLAPGAGDDVVQLIFSQVIKPIFEQYKPEIILGSFGGDAHYSDPLSGLSFTTHGYGHYVEGFKQIADKCCDGKMVLLLEGGYRVKVLAQSIVNILNVLAGQKMPFVESEHESGDNILEYHEHLAKKLKEHLKPYWKF